MTSLTTLIKNAGILSTLTRPALNFAGRSLVSHGIGSGVFAGIDKSNPEETRSFGQIFKEKLLDPKLLAVNTIAGTASPYLGKAIGAAGSTIKRVPLLGIPGRTMEMADANKHRLYIAARNQMASREKKSQEDLAPSLGVRTRLGG